MAIDPVRVEPVGDDQAWKRDVMRALADLIASDESQESKLDQLGRAN